VKVIFIVPCFNASKNLEKLVNSVRSQKNSNWSLVLIDDISDDDTFEKMSEILKQEWNTENKIEIIKNKEKKFALRNIVEAARNYENDDSIIAVIDGDDQLCNENTVDILLKAYSEDHDVVWTGHKWDINGMNISKDMPFHVDPYQWPWCSSHLRTFKSSLLKEISDNNFKNVSGEWFKRGYDQALMLPVIYVAKSRKYVDEICYQYNINSVSVSDRDWAEKIQHSTVNLVRSRGFLEK
jgi:glycosyltransferase involved in cell wall biosynthesis